MKKIFRIVRNELSEEGQKAYKPLWYRIEQRHTLLFFLHFWTTPEFEPPHYFNNDCDAMKCIKEHYPDAIVFDYCSNNKYKK